MNKSSAVSNRDECLIAADGGFTPTRSVTKSNLSRHSTDSIRPARTAITLLTGGFDQPYAFGLSMSLVSQGVELDVIGSDEVDSPEMQRTAGLNFLNLQPGWRTEAGAAEKIVRVLVFYARLILYSAVAKPKVFHILWNSKIAVFDRTVLMLIYKAFQKRIVLTAHNVNTNKRDGTDSVLNRATLRIQYRLSDHIFVHTQKMREELVTDFGVHPAAVTVIPFGINNASPQTDLTTAEAKRRLGVDRHQRTILFFGRIQPYKGLELLAEALELLVQDTNADYQLVIAGEPKKEHKGYWEQIERRINGSTLRDRVVQRIQYIPDTETELYFKAADLLVLPYTGIYQSGVLFLGYSFGLPAVATDVGCFKEAIVEGKTGFLCKPGDPTNLAHAIETYFRSDLYTHLCERRQEIREYIQEQHSWDAIGRTTCRVYADLEQRARP